MSHAAPAGGPRVFTSPVHLAREAAAVITCTPVLVAVFVRRRLDPRERERIMVAVSAVNACRGCTLVHQRWALRTGVSAAELEAIGLGDLAVLDQRSRTAIVYATTLTAAGFHRPVEAEVQAAAATHLTARERSAVEALARLVTLAGLLVNTIGTRARRRAADPMSGSVTARRRTRAGIPRRSAGGSARRRGS